MKLKKIHAQRMLQAELEGYMINLLVYPAIYHVQKVQKKKKKKFISSIVVGVFLFLGLIGLAYPLYPSALYFYRVNIQGLDTFDPVQNKFIRSAENLDGNSSLSSQEKLKELNFPNSLIIPKILTNAQVYEGSSSSTLDKGLWRIPYTSKPTDGGNTVITGHRFDYLGGENTFYHLDKLDIDDEFQIIWDGEVYEYTVNSKKVVDATETEIEAPTEKEQITLYTCHPIWNSKDRLVVIGRPT